MSLFPGKVLPPFRAPHERRSSSTRSAARDEETPDLLRRSLLRGAGVVGVGAVAALATAPTSAASPEGGSNKHKGLPVLGPEEDFAARLLHTPQVQLLPGATY